MKRLDDFRNMIGFMILTGDYKDYLLAGKLMSIMEVLSNGDKLTIEQIESKLIELNK